MKGRLPIFLLAAAPVAAAILAATPASPGAACAASTVPVTHRPAESVPIVAAGFVEGTPPWRAQAQHPIDHDSAGRGQVADAPQGTDWDRIAPADGSAATRGWSQGVPCE